MKLQKRSLYLCYLTGLLLLLGLKFYSSRFSADQLRWILAPTAKWVTVLSGIPFSYEKGAGYVNHDLRLLIAASCSGIQFMLITYAMLAFTFLKKFTGIIKGFLWILCSLLLSYPLTILINGLRIIAAIHLPRFLESHGLLFSFLTPDRLHTAIGTIVYFLALLNIYQLADFIFRKVGNNSRKPMPDTGNTIAQILGKCAAPAFWYFFMVLGLPFLNHAYEKGGSRFTAFALLITLCCGAVLLLHVLVSLLRKIF